MKIPLFLLSQNEGVPFLDCTAHVLVDQERIENHWQDIDSIASIFPAYTKSRFVILGYVHPGHDPNKLYKNFDLDQISEHVHAIGVLARISFEELVNGQRLIQAHGIAYALIHSLHVQKTAISELNTNGKKALKVEWEPLPKTRKEVTSEVVQYFDKILNYCNDNELLSTETKLKLKRTLPLDKKIDIIAFDILDKEDFYDDIRMSQRLAYIQSPCLKEKIDVIIKSLPIESLRRAHNKTKINKKVNDSFSYEDISQRISQIDLPDESIAYLSRELNKLQRLKPDSQDYAITLDYLNLVAALPWTKPQLSKINIKHLIENLNKSHYGLESAKREIAEQIAIQEHTGDHSGTILCFAGPPGTGKTSIAQAIACATDRKLIRIALGGVTDEAVFRGFRRTYFNSKPGRIISSIRDAGTNKVLILLDEIDKLGIGKSDPSAALLEILDPEQNCSFVDQYLEIPYDLSSCMFICTANDVDNLQPALKDRLDILEFPSYNYEDRLHILKNYILPKALKTYNLVIDIEDSILEELAQNPQIRQIEKQLKKTLRSRFLDEQLGTETQLSFEFNKPKPRPIIRGFG